MILFPKYYSNYSSYQNSTTTRTVNSINNSSISLLRIIVLLFVILLLSLSPNSSSTRILFVQCKLLRHQPIISCTTTTDCYIPCILKPCPPIYHCMNGYCKNIKFYEICGTTRICNKGINEFCCNTYFNTTTFNNTPTFHFCSDGVCGSKHKNNIACPKISCSTTTEEESTESTTSSLSTTRIRIPTTITNNQRQSLP